ncbi:hypothetical protein SCHPADRAFT_896917 [Schizopora paradoxa]|uniref:Uncharacterized protein n=1 Tax=Schizopora paradoxa TaxID=27342 RepID=A0A0H2QYE3_9AGAM|nr:hypothetical protein SCHPADRAFT_896917 [Schizopora paradoxa]
MEGRCVLLLAIAVVVPFEHPSSFLIGFVLFFGFGGVADSGRWRKGRSERLEKERRMLAMNRVRSEDNEMKGALSHTSLLDRRRIVERSRPAAPLASVSSFFDIRQDQSGKARPAQPSTSLSISRTSSASQLPKPQPDDLHLPLVSFHLRWPIVCRSYEDTELCWRKEKNAAAVGPTVHHHSSVGTAVFIEASSAAASIGSVHSASSMTLDNDDISALQIRLPTAGGEVEKLEPRLERYMVSEKSSELHPRGSRVHAQTRTVMARSPNTNRQRQYKSGMEELSEKMACRTCRTDGQSGGCYSLEYSLNRFGR